eukprot:526478-Lingulodinium_polyedra.AAC.1
MLKFIRERKLVRVMLLAQNFPHRMECAKRAICESPCRWTVDSTESLCTVSNTVQNDAVESTVCRRSSQVAHLTHFMRRP